MTDFHDFVHEVFARFGPINIRRMFGGHGIFREGLMFAVIHRDTLYLKADSENLKYFQERELGRMRRADGSEYPISYFAAPEEILEDPEEAVIWARRSFDAALRAHGPKAKKKPK